jgi:uncharacterized membrane protein YeaQ/YmgE (transglycosylase-associated protein family)
MSVLITILVGGLIGWLASIVMRTNAQQGILLNILVGVAGAALGRWLFGDVFGIGGAYAAGTFTLRGLLWGVGGAAVLILGLKAIRLLK